MRIRRTGAEPAVIGGRRAPRGVHHQEHYRNTESGMSRAVRYARASARLPPRPRGKRRRRHCIEREDLPLGEPHPHSYKTLLPLFSSESGRAVPQRRGSRFDLTPVPLARLPSSHLRLPPGCSLPDREHQLTRPNGSSGLVKGVGAHAVNSVPRSLKGASGGRRGAGSECNASAEALRRARHTRPPDADLASAPQQRSGGAEGSRSGG